MMFQPTEDALQPEQLSPPRWRAEYELGHGDERSARYRVVARSLSRPPEPEEVFELSIDLDTNRYQPAGNTPWHVWARVVQQHRVDDIWPVRGAVEF